MPELITDDWLHLGLLAVVVWLAGVVRGCIGFGFSALVVAAGSLFLPPAQLVPMVVLLEIAASVQMLPAAWPAVHWRAHNALMLSMVVATPIGVSALVLAPEAVLRLVVALLLLALALLMVSGYRGPGELRTKPLLAMGFASGLINGVAGVGGMPVAMYLSASPLSLAQLRATMVVFFFGTETLFILSALFQGIYHGPLLSTAVLALLPMGFGVWLGGHVFERVDEAQLRRGGVIGLLLLATLGVLRALLSLVG